MIIVKIQGGLGNQMFEYALYEWLRHNGKDAKIDISHYGAAKKSGAADTVHNGYELEKLFSLSPVYATFKEAGRLGEVRTDIIYKLWRKFVRKRNKKTHITRIDFDGNRWYLNELLDMDNIYLDGYWCTYKYADEIRDTVLKSFTFPEFSGEADRKNIEASEIIKNTNSVSIHVRHGDYLKLQNVYCNLGSEYYNNAIKKIEETVESPVFFCFSDDIEWCRENIKAENIHFIDWNKGNDSYKDMQLMSLCKHNILANSTFSMWGAWLNRNPDKRVIRPKRVFVDPTDEIVDFWPDEWVVIDN